MESLLHDYRGYAVLIELDGDGEAPSHVFISAVWSMDRDASGARRARRVYLLDRVEGTWPGRQEMLVDVIRAAEAAVDFNFEYMEASRTQWRRNERARHPARHVRRASHHPSAPRRHPR